MRNKRFDGGIVHVVEEAAGGIATHTGASHLIERGLAHQVVPIDADPAQSAKLRLSAECRLMINA
jgi:hypothetical protein